MAHIVQRHFQARGEVEVKAPSRSTRLEQQQVILKLFDYRACDGVAKAELEGKKLRIAMLSAQPVFILQELLQFLSQKRIVPPGYTYLQDVVGRTVSLERLRITRLLAGSLTPEMEHRLASLLEADEGMYRISLLKHEPKGFSYGQLRQEVERRKFFQPLFAFGQDFLPAAGLWAPFSEVRRQAFSLLDSERFVKVSGYMRKVEFDKAGFEWAFYGTLHAKFKLNLRHLFANLDFAGLVEDAPSLEAVGFLQTLMLHGRSPRQAAPADFPAAIVPRGLQRYLYT